MTQMMKVLKEILKISLIDIYIKITEKITEITFME